VRTTNKQNDIHTGKGIYMTNRRFRHVTNVPMVKTNIFRQVTNTPSLLSMKTHAKRETWRNNWYVTSYNVLHAFIWSKVSPFSYLSKYAIRKHYSFMSSEARTNTAWPQNWSFKRELHTPGTEWRHWGLPLRKRALISLLVLMFLIISVNETYRANRVASYR